MEKAIVDGKMFTSIQTNNYTESRRGHEKKHSKEDFVWILGNLFLATGLLTIGMHYLHSVSIAAPLTHLRSMFQFNQSWNLIIIWKCDM